MALGGFSDVPRCRAQALTDPPNESDSDPDSTCSPLAPLLTVPPARWESLPAVPTQLHCLRNQNTKSDSALAQMTL